MNRSVKIRKPTENERITFSPKKLDLVVIFYDEHDAQIAVVDYERIQFLTINNWIYNGIISL